MRRITIALALLASLAPLSLAHGGTCHTTCTRTYGGGQSCTTVCY